jgi:hypothetical protein
MRDTLRHTEIRIMIHPTEIRDMSEEHIRKDIVHRNAPTTHRIVPIIRIGEIHNKEVPMERAKEAPVNVAREWGNVYSHSNGHPLETMATAAGEINLRTGVINL